MSSEEFRKELVELVKATAQEVIDRAEDLVGEGDFMEDFNIWLNFPIPMDSLPSIEVYRSYGSKRCLDVVARRYSK